jgi:hypothetical protein
MECSPEGSSQVHSSSAFRCVGPLKLGDRIRSPCPFLSDWCFAKQKSTWAMKRTVVSCNSNACFVRGFQWFRIKSSWGNRINHDKSSLYLYIVCMVNSVSKFGTPQNPLCFVIIGEPHISPLSRLQCQAALPWSDPPRHSHRIMTPNQVNAMVVRWPI